MLPAISPVVLKGKSQEAFKMLHKTVDILQVCPSYTKKNYIFVSKNIQDPSNLNNEVSIV